MPKFRMKVSGLFDGKTNPAEKSDGMRILLISFLLVILVLITYSGAVDNTFVSWDDNDYVVNNKLVRNDGNPALKEIFSTVVSLNYHPLTILSLSLNDNKCPDCPNGISARPFVITSICIHAINTILVFILIWLLFRRNLIMAFLVSAIFAVHPMHVESVTWISGRKDVLNSFFFLLALISYILYLRKTREKWLWLIISFVLFIFACLSKATAVVFPVVALLTGYFLQDDQDKGPVRQVAAIFAPRNILPMIPFLAVSVFFGLMAVSIQSGQNFLGILKFIKDPHDVVNTIAPFSLLQRLQIASYGFFFYLVRFFLPINQSAFHPYPSLNEITHGSFSLVLWLSLAAMAVTLILVILSTKKTKLFLYCYGFYFLGLALTLQFVSVGMALTAERYTYLPYILVATIPAYYLTRLSTKVRSVLLFICGLLIIAMILLARRQVDTWHDSGSLWTQVIERYPNLELARSARGKYYYMQSSQTANPGERKNLEDKAMADFNIAIKGNSRTSEVYEGMGVILLNRNELPGALRMLNAAIKLNPDKGRTYFNRAVVLDQLNMKEEAIRDYAKAISLSPEMAVDILRNRSVLFIETGSYDNAIKDLDELIRLDGREFTHYYNRAFSKLMLKDIRGAISDYENVLRLNPGDSATIEHLKVLRNAR